ncbi:MAG: hypothetical protein J0H67_17915 [Rhodospirillales bacterium]|nr:hypothetical protein [Rhodospirillales bacterium]
MASSFWRSRGDEAPIRIPDAAVFFTELAEVMRGGVPDGAAPTAIGIRWGMEFLGPPLAASDG